MDSLRRFFISSAFVGCALCAASCYTSAPSPDPALAAQAQVDAQAAAQAAAQAQAAANAKLAALNPAPNPTGNYVYDNEETPSLVTDKVDFYDYDLFVGKIAKSMVENGLHGSKNKKPVIAFGPIKNNSPVALQDRMIMTDIRNAILRTGLASFTGATDEMMKGGESGTLYKQLAFQSESGLVDPATAAKFGKIVGADYVLYGAFYDQSVVTPQVKEVTFKIQLDLLEVETGLVIWGDSARVKKRLSTGN